MREFEVSEVSSGGILNNGEACHVIIKVRSGDAVRLTFPYLELDVVTQALLGMAGACFDEQVTTGRIPAVQPLNPAMNVRSFRVLPTPSTKTAIVQMIGNDANGRPGIGSFETNEDQLRDLAMRFLEVADQLKQSKQLS